MFLKKAILFIIFIFTGFNIFCENLEINFNEVFEEHKIPRLIINSESGNIIKANKAACKFYGYSLNKILTLNINDINVFSQNKIKEKMISDSNEKANDFRFKHKTSSGRIKNVEVYSYPFVKNDIVYLYSLIVDITPEIDAINLLKKNHNLIIRLSISTIALLFLSIFLLYNLKEKYRYIAFHDYLTGVYTRRLLPHLNSEDFNNKNNFMTIVMIDINDFKIINDKYGHSMGDRVLKKIAKIIKETLRNDDMIIRYGGDEFLLILKGINIEKASSIMTRIESKLPELEEFPFSIKISFGIKESEENQTLIETIKLADQKMYKMKELKVNLIY